MYWTDEINWLKFLLDKDIYIFGAGANGEKLYKQLRLEGEYHIVGVVDNNKDVVDRFKKGNGWLERAYTFSELLGQINSNSFVIVSTAYSQIQQQLLDAGITNFVYHTKLDFSGNGEDYYDEQYFSWQLEFAKVDSVIDADFFQKFIKHEDKIAEFGSGGGMLLSRLSAKEKIGIEINDVARKYAAEKNSINSVKSINELKDNSFDVIISTHALEHCLNPYQIVKDLHSKLKDGGKAVFIVPLDSYKQEYTRDNLSRHLFTWNQCNIGNLFKAAGYYVRSVGMKESIWPANLDKMFSEENRDWFVAVSMLESDRQGFYSVYIVAEK